MSRRLAPLLATATALSLACAFASAEEPDPAATTEQSAAPRLLDRDPFDQIVLDAANDRAVLDILTLDEPQRSSPTRPTSGRLVIRLLQRPTEEFEVAWSSITEVRLYERMLLDEAQRLVAAGDFDEAYDYYARLLSDYPALDGLRPAVNDYLRRNALALFRGGEPERSLAVLATLAERDPRYPGLAEAVESVAGDVIAQHLRRQDFASARAMLDLWQTQLSGVAAPAADAWQQRFQTAADRQVAEARRSIDERDYISARRGARRALAIWPQHAAADQIVAQVQRLYPFVTVGVFEAAPRQPTYRIDDWAAIRASRLVERLLVEQIDFGTEGGIYQSPFGQLSIDQVAHSLSLKLAPAGEGGSPTHDLAAERLARSLLRMADPRDPTFRSAWGNLLAGVSLRPGDELRLDWAVGHVRPESLLQFPPPREAHRTDPPSTPAPFTLADVAEADVVFAAARESGPLRAIVEQAMSDDDETAVKALLAGEIDVLDRVPPWHVAQLRDAAGVRVRTYRLPTVHVLVPNLDRRPQGQPSPLTKREFRRALCYGIPREWIVEQVLTGGEPMPGFTVLSGPFPAGTSLSDPIRYAYNNQLTPRPFEPRLAAILATVAWASILDPEGKGDVELTDLPELVLAHPQDPLARLACQSIEAQLDRVGIPIKLVEFTADELLSGSVEYDLRYAELAMWEPLTDIRRVLGPEGLTGTADSLHLDDALRRLDSASNWQEVRAQLTEIHSIAHHDLAVIPLWQTVNHFAHRTSLAGIGEAPVRLYQEVEQWAWAD